MTDQMKDENREEGSDQGLGANLNDGKVSPFYVSDATDGQKVFGSLVCNRLRFVLQPTLSINGNAAAHVWAWCAFSGMQTVWQIRRSA